MQTWVFKTTAHRPDEEPRELVALASGADEQACLAFAIDQMTLRGWVDIEVSRRVELDPNAKASANDYLLRAIETVEACGFSVIRYGPADH